MQVVVKEPRETLFWVQTCKRAKLVRPRMLDGLAKEVNELIVIGVSSAVTAKSNQRKREK